MRFTLVALLLISFAADADAAKKKSKAKKKKKEAPAFVMEPIPHIEGPLPDLAAPDKPDDAITFAAVGDIMMGSTFPEERLPPEDGAKMLLEVTPVLSAADIAFGNLEGPLAEGGETKKCKKNGGACYAFRCPTRYGQYLLDAGFDVMSLANNHANDFGEDGRAQTMAKLDELGIAHTGPVGDIARLTVRGKKVDVIAFATYAHSHNLNDLETARALVEKSAAEADIVVVSFHGGAEGKSRQRVPHGPEMFHGENRGDLRVFTHAMVDAGADLILGHGPHVIRGIEVYKDRLIVYSLGNFATYGGFNLSGASGLSTIVEATLAPDGKFVSGKAHPLKQIPPGGPVFDDKKELLPLLRDLSEADFPGTAVRVGADGTLLPPEST